MKRVNKGSRVIHTSSLIRDVEKQEEFTRLALICAEGLKSKYFSADLVYSPGDVVNEVWYKILRQDIDFDETKKKSLKGFVKMLVEKKYIDLSRKVKKENGNLSMNVEVFDDGGYTLLDTLGFRDTNLDNVEDEVILNDFFDELPYYLEKRGINPTQGLKLDQILKLRVYGNSIGEIASMLDVNSNQVRNLITKNKKILLDICNDFMDDEGTLTQGV